MDPNLFHLDWDRTIEVLATIVIMSFVIERALALIFENRVYIERCGGKPIKEVIAFSVSFVVCLYWKFDAVSMILLSDHTRIVGEAVTAGVIAGGSKGSAKLFRDVLDWKSGAYDEYEKARTAGQGARIESMQAKLAGASRRDQSEPQG